MRAIARYGLLACAVLACLGVAAVAVANTPSTPTRVVLDRLTKKGEGPTLRGHFTGHLETRNDECETGRTVRLILRNGGTGESRLADTDHTGVLGNWQLDGDLYRIDRAQVKVSRKVIGSGDGRRICKADTLTRHFI